MKGRIAGSMAFGTLLICFILAVIGDSESSQVQGRLSRFEKLNIHGYPLPIDARDWSMVRDNETGLIWEAKTTDGGIHDKNKTFAWEEIDQQFISKLNHEKFGGYSDWRLPDLQEFYTIQSKGKKARLDPYFFPNTAAGRYWSHTSCCDGKPIAFKVDFGGNGKKERSLHIRAVRGSFSRFANSDSAARENTRSS